MATRNFLQNCNNGTEVGLVQDLWVSIETGDYGEDATGGTFPTAADYIEHLGMQLNYTQAREDSEARSGLSLATRLTGKIETTWEGSFYIIPKDPTGGGSDEPELPDLHPFLYGLFGSYDDTSSATETVYSFTDCNTISLRSYILGLNYSQLGVGLAVNEGTFSLPGDGIAQATFSGFAQTVYDAQRGVLSADVVASNDLVLNTGEGTRFDVGSHIDIVNESTGAVIESNREILSKTGDTLTVDGAAINATTGNLITPTVLDSTDFDTSEKAMTGISGSVAIDGIGALDCDVINAEIAINNNLTPLNNRYGTDRICGFVSDTRREITVSLELEFNQNTYDLYRKAKTFDAANVTIKLKPNNGDAALGRTFTFSIPRLELNIPEVAFEADSVVTIPFEGRALSTDPATPNEEITLTIGPV